MNTPGDPASPFPFPGTAYDVVALRLGEQEALRRLQRLASGQGRAVAEVALALLNTEDTFRQLEAPGVNGER